jgi:transcriptional regulator with XRE-family HTH domain
MSVCRRCFGTGVELDLRAAGQQLRSDRTRAGLTALEVARLAKVSAAYVCDIEHGRRAVAGAKAQRIFEVVRRATGEPETEPAP